MSTNKKHNSITIIPVSYTHLDVYKRQVLPKSTAHRIGDLTLGIPIGVLLNHSNNSIDVFTKCHGSCVGRMILYRLFRQERELCHQVIEKLKTRRNDI